MRWAVCAGLAVCLWGTTAHAKAKIAVFGVEPIDAGDSKSRQKTGLLSRSLTKALRERVKETDLGYELAANATKEWAELKLLSDCLDEAPACMAGIGKDYKADVIVYGRVEKQKEGYLVTIQSLVVPDPKKAPPFSAKRSYAFGAASEDAMKKLAEETMTLQPSAETLLVVEVNAPTGSVVINGVPKGTIVNGTVSIKGLPAGPSMVVVESPGYERYEQNVEVRPGVTTKVSVELNKAVITAPAVPIELPPPVTERPGGTARVLFWTSLIATGAGVAAFTITGLQVKSIEKEQDTALAEWGDGYKSNGVTFPDDACAEARNDGYTKLVDICDRGKSMATVTNVLIGVTAAAAVATAFFAWQGYLSTGSSDERVAQRKKPPRVLVTPAVYKDGGGIGAVVQF